MGNHLEPPAKAVAGKSSGDHLTPPAKAVALRKSGSKEKPADAALRQKNTGGDHEHPVHKEVRRVEPKTFRKNPSSNPGRGRVI